MNVKEKSPKMYQKKNPSYATEAILHLVKVYWFCAISETTLTHKTDNPFYTCHLLTTHDR